MKNVRNILACLTAVMYCCLFSSCCLKEYPEVVAEDMTVEMRLATRADGDGTVSDPETAVHNLKVYIFHIGESGNRSDFAGYYETNNAALDPKSFLVDMKVYRENTQRVRFYVIANDAAMADPSVTLNKNTTEAQIKSLYYTGLNDIKTNGLPMIAVQETYVDVSYAKGEMVDENNTASNKSDHLGHYQVPDRLAFSLERAVAKLNVGAVREEAETEHSLTIESVSIVRRASKGYLVPSADLSSVADASEVFLFKADDSVAPVTVDKNLAKDADRTAIENYNLVSLTPCYLFETAIGSDPDNWSTPVEGGAVLKIGYKFGGDAITSYGVVNLPKISRNNQYDILCLMKRAYETDVEVSIEVNPWIETRCDVPSFN